MVQILETHKAIKSDLTLLYPSVADNKYNTFYRFVKALLLFQKEHDVYIINPMDNLTDKNIHMVFKSQKQCKLVCQIATLIFMWIGNSSERERPSERLHNIRLQICNNKEARDVTIDEKNYCFNYFLTISMLLQSIKPYINFIFKNIHYVRYQRMLIEFVRELATIRPKLFMDLHFDTNNFEMESITQLSQILKNHRTINTLENLHYTLDEFVCIMKDETNWGQHNTPNKYEHFVISYADHSGIAEDYYKEDECYIDVSELTT